MATQSDRELWLSQTNRGVGGVCAGGVPRVQSKLCRALHAHRGKKLLQDLQTLKSVAMKRAMVRFKGAREKGAMTFVECLGISQEDRMEGSLWSETLGRSLGSMTLWNVLVGCIMAMFAGNKPLAFTPYLAQRQDGAPSPTIGCPTEHWLDPFARAKSNLLLKVHGPSEKTSGRNGRLDPLRMDVTTEAGVLFDNYPRRKKKALLLNITTVNLCVGSNLGNVARHVGKHLAGAVERKKTKYRGSFPATYSLFVSLSRRVVSLAQTCIPSSRSSPSGG